MKPLKIVVIVVTSLVLIGGAGYLFAANSIKSKPGYAKLGEPQGESITAVLSINAGPGAVKPLRWVFEKIADNSDHADAIPERLMSSVMQELQGVQLRVYDLGANRQVFDNAIDDSVRALKEKSWQTLVTVRKDDVKIAVLQYPDGQQIAGLSIMASTPEKALFLNLIGPFDVHAIAQNSLW